MSDFTHSSSSTLPDAVQRVAQSVIGLGLNRRRSGSACLWKPGVLVTAASAVWRSPQVRLVLPNGEALTAEVRGVDPATDLAVIPIGAANIPPVERGPEAGARVGDFVFAAGREPSGLVHASFGRIGAASGAWKSWRGGAVDQLIRLDGGLYPGLNGAPVADANGKVIGIASQAFSRFHGVVLPISTVDRVAAQLVDHGRVARGYLGIAAQTVHLGDAVKTALAAESDSGLLVHSVAEDGPAARAGVLVGDIIVAAAKRRVETIEALRDVLAAVPIGIPLRLSLARGGQPVELDVEVAEQRASGCH